MPPFPPLMEVPGTYAFWSTHGASAWRQHQQHSTMNQFPSTIQHSAIRSNPAVPLFHNEVHHTTKVRKHPGLPDSDATTSTEQNATSRTTGKSVQKFS